MGDKTDKNEPGRFLGEGVSFRAKLIGVLEVPEARGDRMCQEALSDLKMAIRAAGEHKQRIQVHVAIDGLRLRDDKTGDSLYHHPVHKISFIAQDMTDSRAFGYIFGSPDTGHRFFGIKTDKAASQVVIAMRDLFQVVFELKKKEVEMAKQLLEGKPVGISLARPINPQTFATDKMKQNMIISRLDLASTAPSKTAEATAESNVAELVDLEQELCSLRRGLTQVEGLTPSADPFGDSFIVPTSQSQKGLIPPPPSGTSTRGRNTPAASRTVFSPSKQPSLAFDLAPSSSDFDTPPTSLVDNMNVPSEPAVCQTVAPSTQSLSYDVFTELDPLGTGKSKPYVDKKLFFQELKNPPKKVLKDLAQVNAEAEKDYGPATTMTSLTRHSGGSVAIAKPQPGGLFGASFFSSDPFAETDPFDNTDPFSDSFKDDPFTSMQDFPKSVVRTEELKKDGGSVAKKSESNKEPFESEKNVFNGPLQVSLPPEPAPKSPRMQRQQSTESRGSGVRRGRNGGSVSPPPPLPPKKCADISVARPPPRPPLDLEIDSDPAPPLPRPSRKKEPMADRSTKPRLSSLATNSSEDEYLTPAPPPLPAARRFDITLSQLLTCSMDELAHRLRVPSATLSSMTLPQLTDYLRSYLAADNERAHIHIDPSHLEKSKHISAMSIIQPASKSPRALRPLLYSVPTLSNLSISSEFKPKFEDNFTPPHADSSDTFVANFDDFEQKANASYDRYAAFREIQEQEMKTMLILDPLVEPKQDSDEKEEFAAIDTIMRENLALEIEAKETSKSPLKSLDELTIDSFNMFRSSVSPKPAHTPIDAKIDDIKSVMKNLQIETLRRSVSPRDNGHVEVKQEDTNDRYAALREITITEPPDEFESLPPEIPKERKKSDEKSDGFDNSDFFDCIDNSSLSFSHVEDAFRKSPVVKEREDVKEEKEVRVELTPLRELQPPLERLSIGSISDVVSGSSPDTKDKVKVVSSGVGGVGGVGAGGRWAVLGGAGGSGASSDSRDSEPRPRRRRNISPTRRHHVQTSSSSRDVSPWDEDLPPVTRLPRPLSHHRDRESKHNSSGSRECLDSGSGREKDKLRDKRDMRDRDLSRDSRESGRERRDSGSGRDRRDSKERDLRYVSRDKRDMSCDSRDSARERRDSGSGRDRRDSKERDLRYVSRDKCDMSCDSRESARDRRDSGSGRDRRDSNERDQRDHRRDRRSREREPDTWDRDRTYSRDYRDSRSRERQKEYREKDRHRKPRHSYDEEEDYSDGCGSGRSSSRDRWPDRERWRRDERNYGSLGWRETRRRAETRQRDTTEDPRYSSTLGWPGRRSARRDEREREDRDARRRPRREEPRRRDYRFSNDFSPREPSPFDDEAPGKKRVYPGFPECTRYAIYTAGLSTNSAVGNPPQTPSRFTYEPEKLVLPSLDSPISASSARRDGESPATRFRFDSDSISPRSMFEDDFTTISTPRGRTVSIAEEEESDLPPLRAKPPQQHRDIKKSESINIFTRESDPFEGDAFFACTGSDRAARRENWPGDFQGFDNA